MNASSPGRAWPVRRDAERAAGAGVPMSSGASRAVRGYGTTSRPSFTQTRPPAVTVVSVKKFHRT
jgi:hypothetical protein